MRLPAYTSAAQQNTRQQLAGDSSRTMLKHKLTVRIKKAVARLCILLITVVLVSTLNNSCTQAKKDSTDEQAEAMLRDFYTSYITEFASDDLSGSEKRLHALQARYCTKMLLDSIAYEDKYHELDYDPFIQAQDADKECLKTLSINKAPEKSGLYTVSYVVGTYSAKIHLIIKKQKNGYKISSVW